MSLIAATGGVTNYFSPKTEIVGGATICGAAAYFIAGALCCTPIGAVAFAGGAFVGAAQIINGLWGVKMTVGAEKNRMDERSKNETLKEKEKEKYEARSLFKSAAIITGIISAIPFLTTNNTETFISVARVVGKISAAAFLGFSGLYLYTFLSK